MFKKISSYITLHAAFISALFPSWGWTSQVSVYPVCGETQPSRLFIYNQSERDIDLRLALSVPVDISIEGWQGKVQNEGCYFLDMHSDQRVYQDGNSILYKLVRPTIIHNVPDTFKLYHMMSGEIKCRQGAEVSYEMSHQHAFGFIHGIAHIVKAKAVSDLVERNYGWTSEVRDGDVHLTLVSDKSQTQAIPSSPYVVQRNILDAYFLYKQYYMQNRASAHWFDFIHDWKSQGSGVMDVKRTEEVVVSLTSYPTRVETTWLAIESLLRQSEKPDRIVLNLFEGEFPGCVIPYSIREQMKRGLEVSWISEPISNTWISIYNPHEEYLTFNHLLGMGDDLELIGKIILQNGSGNFKNISIVDEGSIVRFDHPGFQVETLAIEEGSHALLDSVSFIQNIENDGEILSQNTLDFSHMDPSHLDHLGIIKSQENLNFNLRELNAFEFLKQYQYAFFAASVQIRADQLISQDHLLITFPLELLLNTYVSEHQFEADFLSLTTKKLQNGTSVEKMAVLKSSHLRLDAEEIQSEFGVIQADEVHVSSSKALKMLKATLIAQEFYMDSNVAINVSESIIDSIIQEYETPGLFKCVGTQFIGNHPTTPLLARQIFKVGKYEGASSKTSEVIHNPMHEPNRLSKFGLGLTFNYEESSKRKNPQCVVHDWDYVYSRLWGELTEYFPRCLGRPFPGVDRIKESLKQRLTHHCSGNMWITAHDSIEMIGPEIKVNKLFLKAKNPIQIVPLTIESKAEIFHLMENQWNASYRKSYHEELLEIEMPSIELTCSDDVDLTDFNPVLHIQSDTKLTLQSLQLKAKGNQWISFKAPIIHEQYTHEYCFFSLEDIDKRGVGQRWYQPGKYNEAGHWVRKPAEKIWIPRSNFYDIDNLCYDCETGISEYVELPHCHKFIDKTQHRSIISALEDYQSSYGAIEHGFESLLFDCKKQAKVCRRVIGEKFEKVQDEIRPSETLYCGDVREFCFASTLWRDQKYEAIQGVKSSVYHGNMSGRSFDIAKVTLPEWKGSDIEKLQATAHGLSQTSEAFTLVFNILANNPLGIAMQALSGLSVTSSSSSVTTKVKETQEAAPAVYYGDTTIARPISIEGVAALLAMKDPHGEIERIELRAPRYTFDSHTQEIHKSKSWGILSYNETRTEINRYYGQKSDMPSYLMLMGQNAQLSIGDLHLTGTALARADQGYDINALMNSEQGVSLLLNQDESQLSALDRGQVRIQKAFIKAAIDETTQKIRVQSESRGFNPLALMSGGFMRAVQWGHINDKDEGYTRRVADIDFGNSGSDLVIGTLQTEGNSVSLGSASVASHDETSLSHLSTRYTDSSPWTNGLILAQSALSMYESTRNIAEKSISLSRLGNAQSYSRDIKRIAIEQGFDLEKTESMQKQAFDHYLQTGEQDVALNEGLAKLCIEKYEREQVLNPHKATSSIPKQSSTASPSHVTTADLYHSLSALGEDLNADDPSLIMPQFMEDHFLGDDDINPLTGYSESFRRSLSETSLGLYEEFERASQNFETLKSEGKPLGDAIRHHYLSEQAFNDRQEDSFKNEARSQFSRLVKDGVVDTAEWAAANPFAAAYATGEMALSTAGAVMTGGRNAYEVAFHGKQLKAAAFETAVAFAATKGAIKAYKGVSRLVSRGVGVKKLSLVSGKGVPDAYRGLRGQKPTYLPKGVTSDKLILNQQGQWVLDSSKFSSSREYWKASDAIIKDGKLFQEHHIISDKFRDTMDHRLWEAAELDPNLELNKMFMPTKQGAQFGTNMRSIHDGKHLGEVNKNLAKNMDIALRKGENLGWTQEQYAQALKGIIREERIELTLGNRMLNKNARPHAKRIDLENR